MRKETFTSKTLSKTEEDINTFVQNNKSKLKYIRKLHPYKINDLYYIDVIYEERNYRLKTRFN